MCAHTSRALSWLKQSGALDERMKPADRWNEDTLRRFVATFEVTRHDAATNDRRVMPYKGATGIVRLHGIYCLLKVMQPNSEIEFFRRFTSQFKRSQDRDFSNLPTLDELASLSNAMIEEARAATRRGPRAELVPLEAACLFRAGVQIRLLTESALRVGNFQSVTFDPAELRSDGKLKPQKHVVRHLRHGLPRRWSLQFPPSEVKNKQHIDQTVPPASLQLIKEYVDEYRPTLCSGHYKGAIKNPGDGLWISRRGGTQSVLSIQRDIAKFAKDRLGKKMTPHMFPACLGHNIFDG